MRPASFAECVADGTDKPGFIGRCPIRLKRAPFCDVAQCAMFDLEVRTMKVTLDEKCQPFGVRPNDQWKAPTPELEGHRKRLREALGNTFVG
jgi:hypothetical protein